MSFGREIPIEPGDIFSKAKVTTGLRNLYNLQYFSAIVPRYFTWFGKKIWSTLVINVEEQSNDDR